MSESLLSLLIDTSGMHTRNRVSESLPPLVQHPTRRTESIKAAKAAVVEKDAAIAKSLQLARKEKDAFDVDLKAAKTEAGRFRDMVETRADMDDDYRVRPASIGDGGSSVVGLVSYCCCCLYSKHRSCLYSAF